MFRRKPAATAAPAVADAFLLRIGQVTDQVRRLEERANATATQAGTGPDPQARLRSAEAAARPLESFFGEVERAQATLQAMAAHTLQGAGRLSETDRAMANAAMQSLAETGSGLASTSLHHAGTGTLEERVQALVRASTLLNHEHKAITRLAFVGLRAPEVRLHVDAAEKALQAVSETHGRLLPLVAQVQAKVQDARNAVASWHDDQVQQIAQQTAPLRGWAAEGGPGPPIARTGPAPASPHRAGLTDAGRKAMAGRLVNGTREPHNPQRDHSPARLEQWSRDPVAGVTEGIDDLRDAAVEKLQDGVDKRDLRAHARSHDKDLACLVQPGDTTAQGRSCRTW